MRILYRIVPASEGERIRREGLVPVPSSSGAEWGGEERLYFWAKKHAARQYWRFLVNRAELAEKPAPELALVTVRVRGADAKLEDDPSAVARDFGDVYYVNGPISPAEVGGVEYR